MAVINPYSSAVAAMFADNAVQTRQEGRVMRDSEAERRTTDIQTRMTLEQIASSQKQTELTVNIAQKGASAVQNGIQLGQKLGDVGEHIRINSDLQSGAASYGQDQGAALLDTDLGNGQTVEDVLGTDAQGNRIEDPAQRREVAQAKLDTLMHDPSAEDLERAGFSEGERTAILNLKDRGSGNELTTDEAVEYLFNRSSVVQEDQSRDRIHKAADMIIKDVAFVPSQQAAKIGQKSAKDAAKTVSEDGSSAQRNGGTQSRMTWLAVEQLNMAGDMATNKKNQSYKP